MTEACFETLAQAPVQLPEGRKQEALAQVSQAHHAHQEDCHALRQEMTYLALLEGNPYARRYLCALEDG